MWLWWLGPTHTRRPNHFHSRLNLALTTHTALYLATELAIFGIPPKWIGRHRPIWTNIKKILCILHTHMRRVKGVYLCVLSYCFAPGQRRPTHSTTRRIVVNVNLCGQIIIALVILIEAISCSIVIYNIYIYETLVHTHLTHNTRTRS